MKFVIDETRYMKDLAFVIGAAHCTRPGFAPRVLARIANAAKDGAIVLTREQNYSAPASCGPLSLLKEVQAPPSVFTIACPPKLWRMLARSLPA